MKPDASADTPLVEETQEQQERLITVLRELEDEVEKQNSFGRTFIRGALNGLGTVVGASLLLAVLASMIALVLETLGISHIPYLSDFIRSIVTEQLNQQ